MRVFEFLFAVTLLEHPVMLFGLRRNRDTLAKGSAAKARGAKVCGGRWSALEAKWLRRTSPRPEPAPTKVSTNATYKDTNVGAQRGVG